MIKSYENETNTCRRYIPISEVETTLEAIKKLKDRIEYRDFGAISGIDNPEEYNLIVDDAKSLEQFITNELKFKLERPLDVLRRTLFLLVCGKSEDTEGIEYLIKQGAEINRCDLLGENALMYVIQNEIMPTDMKLKAVQLLLDNGIDINWVNTRFATPLMLALNCLELEVANLLIANGGVIYKPPVTSDSE